MACDQREKTLVEFVAGELSETMAIGLEQHLADCEECQTAVRLLTRMTRPSAGTAWQPEARLAERILRRARDEGFAAPAPAKATGGPRSVGWAAITSWISRPLPSYAAAGIAALALGFGLVVGTAEVRSRDPEYGGAAHPSAAPASSAPERDRTSLDRELPERPPDGGLAGGAAAGGLGAGDHGIRHRATDDDPAEDDAAADRTAGRRAAGTPSAGSADITAPVDTVPRPAAARTGEPIVSRPGDAFVTGAPSSRRLAFAAVRPDAVRSMVAGADDSL